MKKCNLVIGDYIVQYKLKITNFYHEGERKTGRWMSSSIGAEIAMRGYGKDDLAPSHESIVIFAKRALLSKAASGIRGDTVEKNMNWVYNLLTKYDDSVQNMPP